MISAMVGGPGSRIKGMALQNFLLVWMRDEARSAAKQCARCDVVVRQV